MIRPTPAVTVVLTVGHSNRDWQTFLGLLTGHEVALLMDVRTAPGSRRHPQFNQAAMEPALAAAGIGYEHAPDLGGFRRPRPDSPHAGWENDAFRGYADYMQTPPFAAALQHLMQAAATRRTAIMCSEALPWRCHRRLISDALLVRGLTVEHISSATQRLPHHLTAFCRPRGADLFYPPAEPTLFDGAPP
jgi:uncharacterized protein (DUF488 family)